MFKPSPGYLATCVVGIAFCLCNAFGINLLCLGGGCQVYAGYTLFGFNFYYYGTAAFTVLLLGGWTRRRGYLAAGLGIILVTDLGFLIWQAFFWSCLGCLTVAALFGLAVWIARPMVPAPSWRILRGVLLVWFCFWALALVNLGRNELIRPWALQGDPKQGITVFFSPTCSACRQVVQSLLELTPPGTIAFVPVAKNQQDRDRLARWRAESPLNPSLLSLFESTAAPATLTWIDRLHLLGNQSLLARHGATSVPLIVSNAALVREIHTEASAQTQLQAPSEVTQLPVADPLAEMFSSLNVSVLPAGHDSSCSVVSEKACD